jgi:hypothetical protein
MKSLALREQPRPWPKGDNPMSTEHATYVASTRPLDRAKRGRAQTSARKVATVPRARGRRHHTAEDLHDPNDLNSGWLHALSLASLCGLRVIPSSKNSFVGLELNFNIYASWREQQGFVLRCVARWVANSGVEGLRALAADGEFKLDQQSPACGSAQHRWTIAYDPSKSQREQCVDIAVGLARACAQTSDEPHVVRFGQILAEELDSNAERPRVALSRS